MPETLPNLTDTLGLEPGIAGFFSTRKVPQGNEYWLNMANYISAAPGYLFIPVYFDLLIKQNIDAKVLLTEDLLVTMEAVLKSAGKLEYRKITHAQHIDECRKILKDAGVLDKNITRVEHDLVNRPFAKIHSRFSSLRRANTFLYAFAGRKLDFGLLHSTWELIVPLFLMLDDFSDIEKDMAEHEENCLLDGAHVYENFFELNALADMLIKSTSKINPSLASYLAGMKSESVARNMLPILVKGTS
jgi:hypothetical protein